MRSLFPICPRCGSSIEYKNVNFKHPFPCPTCQTELRIPQSYSGILLLIEVLAAGLVSFALGFRGWKLALAAVVIWLPLAFLLFGVVRHLNPPRVELLRPDFRDKEL